MSVAGRYRNFQNLVVLMKKRCCLILGGQLLPLPVPPFPHRTSTTSPLFIFASPVRVSV